MQYKNSLEDIKNSILSITIIVIFYGRGTRQYGGEKQKVEKKVWVEYQPNSFLQLFINIDQNTRNLLMNGEWFLKYCI